jgi:NhaA family Na+:H+ antiporter
MNPHRTPSPKPQPLGLLRALRPFQQFYEAGSLGGVVLVLCAAFGLAWANSPWQESYFHLWKLPLSLGWSDGPLTLTLHHWINDGLMAVFFLLVGLEIKRELLVGELSTPRQAALPIAAALGGMIVPAALYALVNAGTPGARGWAIPMATDIAFALGILQLAGPRVPLGLKVFLAALAIVDDMGSVGVIALFYSGSLDLQALAWLASTLAGLVVLNRLRVRHLGPYLVLGLVLWGAVHASGLHATLAGVLLAFTIPVRTRIDAAEFSARSRDLIDEFDRAETGDLQVLTSKGQQEAIHALESASEAVQAPLLRLEQALHGLVSFGVMPLFALANAGVALDGATAPWESRVGLGVVLGLLVGKPLGIFLFAWIAVRLGFAGLPRGSTWREVHAVAWLGGIGFTMALFIAELGFAGTARIDEAKVAILMGSIVAGVVGWGLLWRARGSAGAARRATGTSGWA